MKRIATVLLVAAFLAAGLAACEPKPPKPRVDAGPWNVETP